MKYTFNNLLLVGILSMMPTAPDAKAAFEGVYKIDKFDFTIEGADTTISISSIPEIEFRKRTGLRQMSWVLSLMNSSSFYGVNLVALVRNVELAK